MQRSKIEVVLGELLGIAEEFYGHFSAAHSQASLPTRVVGLVHVVYHLKRESRS